MAGGRKSLEKRKSTVVYSGRRKSSTTSSPHSHQAYSESKTIHRPSYLGGGYEEVIEHQEVCTNMGVAKFANYYVYEVLGDGKRKLVAYAKIAPDGTTLTVRKPSLSRPSLLKPRASVSYPQKRKSSVAKK